MLIYETEERLILNTQMLVEKITEAKLQGEDSNKLAYLFHEMLAKQITAACIKAREKSGINKAALSGGVFQNRLLLRLTEEQLMQEGFTVLRHRMIPPNDGGIAIGQAAYGMYQLQNKQEDIKMCVGLSAKVVKINNGTAVIDADGAKRQISAQLLEDLEPGDYVMVHAGVAIAKITDEDDNETDQLMEELL